MTGARSARLGPTVGDRRSVTLDVRPLGAWVEVEREREIVLVGLLLERDGQIRVEQIERRPSNTGPSAGTDSNTGADAGGGAAAAPAGDRVRNTTTAMTIPTATAAAPIVNERW